MYRKVSVVLFSLLILPALVFAGTTGKIKGKVVDRETKEPLPGANILVEGTTLGASTDLNGEYVILNVPVGGYTVKATFIGYRTVTVSNVRVSVDLTTELNFDMPTEAVEIGEVSIVAERPIVNKNATNSQTVRTAEEIKDLPIRSYATVVNLSAGVVSDISGNTYVRGGRVEETAYYVDGVYQNNLRTGGRSGDLAASSVEELSVQAGGFNAEYGFASSGVVNAVTKSGGTVYNVYGEYITDEWLSQKEKNIGTYSYGYNVYNVAFSGPLPYTNNKVKFYLSGERDFYRDQSPSIGRHPVLVEQKFPRSKNAVSTNLIDVAVGKEGPLPNNALGRYLFNGNVTFDFNKLKFKLGGNGTYTDGRNFGTANALYNLDRNSRSKGTAQSLYLKATHALSTNTFYAAQVNYFADGGETFDPYLQRDIYNYGDKFDFNKDGIFNPNLRDQGLNVTSDGNTANLFNPAGVVFNGYAMDRSSYLGGKLDLTHQVGRTHELKLGGEFRYHTLRRWATTPMEIAQTFYNNPGVSPELVFRGAYTNAYGFKLVQNPGLRGDLLEENSDQYDKAKHPILFAAYLQDKIEVSDLVLNLGVRLDVFDSNDWALTDPYNVVINDDGTLNRDQLRVSKSNSTISPRLGLAFPITDRTVFYGQFGKFTQQPQLQFLYTGWELMANQLAAGNQVIQSNPELKPTKTTSYEIGFRQQIGEAAALDITAYYKETRDLIQSQTLVGAYPIPYQRYTNGDYGTIKGLSFNFNLRRTNRVSANLAYTLQFAGGTGSTANSGFNVGWLGGAYPTYVAPADFDQRHTGSLDIDVRLNKNDGPTVLGVKPLGNMGLNLLLTYGSGFAYTPRNVGDAVQGAGFATAYPRAAINSAYGPWQTQLDLRLNRAFDIEGLKFDVYLWGLNVLGTENINPRAIYGATGVNYDDGYLDSPEGKAWIEKNGGEPAANLRHLRTNNATRWSIPRQLRLGLRFDLNPGTLF
jgi:outer membrane receptor protein involved in Fe transport